MSEQEIYEGARQRIDKRNQRWTLWALNLGVLILSVAGIVFLSDTGYETLAAGIMLTCAAVFVAHTIILGMTESRDADIEKEIAKLRAAVYEKPKRLELSDDGELVYEDWEAEEAERTSRA
jgi:hypothetical protein